MRRSFVVIFVAALAMWAGDASYAQADYSLRTPGAELIELRAGYGRAVIGRRGSVLIRVSVGRIRVVDLPGGGTWKNLVTEAKSKVAETLEEYRGNYRYNLMDEHMRRFNAQVAQYVQWDDHEVTNNWFHERILEDDRYTVKNVALLAARAKRAMYGGSMAAS